MEDMLIVVRTQSFVSIAHYFFYSFNRVRRIKSAYNWEYTEKTLEDTFVKCYEDCWYNLFVMYKRRAFSEVLCLSQIFFIIKLQI